MKLDKLRKTKNAGAWLERRGRSRMVPPLTLQGFDLSEFAGFMKRMDPDWAKAVRAKTSPIHRG